MNIAIDLDGTIASWPKGDDDARNVGDPIEGSLHAIRTFQDLGLRVIIHTCRATWEDGGGVPAVVDFFVKHGFLVAVVCGREEKEFRHGEYLVTPWDRMPENVIGVWYGRAKPIAMYYIDDRAIHYSDSNAYNWKVIENDVVATVRALR
jgi:hypothetical protein